MLSYLSYFVILFSKLSRFSTAEVVLTHSDGFGLAVMADNAAAMLLELASAAAEPSAGRNYSRPAHSQSLAPTSIH